MDKIDSIFAITLTVQISVQSDCWQTFTSKTSKWMCNEIYKYHPYAILSHAFAKEYYYYKWV